MVGLIGDGQCGLGGHFSLGAAERTKMAPCCARWDSKQEGQEKQTKEKRRATKDPLQLQSSCNPDPDAECRCNCNLTYAGQQGDGEPLGHVAARAIRTAVLVNFAQRRPFQLRQRFRRTDFSSHKSFFILLLAKRAIDQIGHKSRQESNENRKQHKNGPWN